MLRKYHCGQWRSTQDFFGYSLLLLLGHVAAREDVRAHCITWPMENTDHFSSCVGTVVSLANGNQKAGFAKLKALSKKETSSEHAPVELSGIVDVRGLPPKASTRCK